jgi:uncharacterized membrane protein YcaP (DUF421 family)
MNWATTWHDLTHMDISVMEKVLRTVLVYFGIVVILRVAGKRVLSQLNTFDLVVVLLLSNVVQNAIIGPDNSLVGGLIGALVLVAFNALWERLAGVNPTIRKLVEGSPTVLVQDGEPRVPTIRRIGLRRADIVATLRSQGAERLQDVESAQLQPRGTISLDLVEDARTASYGELRTAVGELRAHLDERMAAFEAMLTTGTSRPAPPLDPPAAGSPG